MIATIAIVGSVFAGLYRIVFMSDLDGVGYIALGCALHAHVRIDAFTDILRGVIKVTRDGFNAVLNLTKDLPNA